jgi:transcriptional regulator with XRE-family HTH domain
VEKSWKTAIGRRVRDHRKRLELSVRELARVASVTPSLVSQVENGRVAPSVGTLYRLAEGLEIAVDQLFRDGEDDATGPGPASEPRGQPAPAPQTERSLAVAPIVPADRRDVIELAGGVTWALLRPVEEAVREDFELMEVTYAPQSESAPDLIRHRGREYGVVLEGRLCVRVNDETVALDPGDSIAFDSGLPHRLYNPHSEPVRSIWVVIGRGGTRSVR